jgi:phosphate transport system substrate-binding protein
VYSRKRISHKFVHSIRFLLIAAIMASLYPSAVSAETIKIGGSGTNLGTMRVLAQSFKKSHPEADLVVLPSLGSGGGVKALIAGAIAIAVTSRPLKNSEKTKGAVALEYGRTPFVIATAKRNVPSGFTAHQLAEIYTGKTNRWPDGSNLHLVLRPPTDSDSILLRSISAEMSQALETAFSRKGLTFALTDQDSANSIATIPGALGTSTLTLILSEKRPLKPLSLNGVGPSPESIADGSYPYFKRLFIATHPRKSSPLAQRFVSFVFSEAGRTILISNGNFPLSSKTGL